MLSFWCAARLMARREAPALHYLNLAGYVTYCARLRAQRVSYGRRIEVRPLLFPGYCLVFIELQWHAGLRDRPRRCRPRGPPSARPLSCS
jgi:hypothetical protein